MGQDSCHRIEHIPSFAAILPLCNGSELEKVSDLLQIAPSVNPPSLVFCPPPALMPYSACHFQYVSFSSQGLWCYANLPAVDLSDALYSHFILEGTLRYLYK